MKSPLCAVAGVLMVTSLFQTSAAAGKPEDWSLAGMDPASDVMEVDDTVAHGGKSSAYLT